jgi:hypothetical protein
MVEEFTDTHLFDRIQFGLEDPAADSAMTTFRLQQEMMLQSEEAQKCPAS